MSDLEKLFFKIDKQVEENKGEGLYFDSLVNCLTLENDEDYFDIVDNFSKEDIKKAYQFLLLKALKELNNPSYDITPEVITMYVSHILECLLYFPSSTHPFLKIFKNFFAPSARPCPPCAESLCRALASPENPGIPRQNRPLPPRRHPKIPRKTNS